MDLRSLLGVVRRRWRIIVVITLLGVALASIFVLRATPTYIATTQVYVSSSSDAPGVVAAYQGGQLSRQRVGSYVNMVTSPAVLDPVISELGLRTSRSGLARRISVESPPETVLINISVTDSIPRRAQAVADAVGEQFGEFVPRLEVESTAGDSPVKVSVIRDADLPQAAATPKVKVDLILGFVVGLLVGLAAALARDVLDTSVKGSDELSERLGLNTVGVIGYDPTAAKDPLISASGQQTPRSEAMRQLRTNLQFLNVDSAPKSIVVCSSIPGEGKTTTASNLAIAVAQTGAPVILVEGDLRRPKVAEYMGLEGSVGLTDVLVGRTTVEDVLQPWGSWEQMWVLPSGQIPPNPSEILGSQHLSDLLRTLESVGLVIIDGPPLLPVTDGSILAAQASGALLVVKARSTSINLVRRAVDNLASVDARLYGVVLNMVPTRGPDSYGYGYGYSYESDSGTRSSELPVESALRPASLHRGRTDDDDRRVATAGRRRSAPDDRGSALN